MTLSVKGSLVRLGVGLASSIGLPRFLHSHVYKKQLSVLMYHAVVRDPLQVADWCFIDEGTFQRQIAYITQHFRVVSLREGIAMLATGSVDGPTLAVTFDDGYQNNYDIAFPILSSYNCPATIFLTTKYIDSDLIPWFGRLNLALTRTAKQFLVWNGVSFNLSTLAQRANTSVSLHKSLKQRHPYSIDGLVTEISKMLAVDADEKFGPGSPYHMLRTSAIRAMIKSGLITFGAHTHTHSILSRLSVGDQQEEIACSLSLVREFTGENCEFFAYPNGSISDYDPSTMKLLESSGVLGAASTISGPNTIDTSPLELRRYGVGSDLTFWDFQSMVHHLTHKMQQLSLRLAVRA